MLKIAIVEDAKDNRDFLYYLLRDEYEVVRYENGEEAVQKIHEDAPDLVILDIWLREMDGVDVLNTIRQDQALHSVPVIAVTANAMTGDREKYLAAGFDEYISKPIDIDKLLAAIDQRLPRSNSA